MGARVAGGRSRTKSWNPAGPRRPKGLTPLAGARLAEAGAHGSVADALIEGPIDGTGLGGRSFEIAGSRFVKARWHGAEVDGWRLRDVEFDGCDLAGLVGADMVVDAAVFRGSRLAGCAWVGATVRDVSFADVTTTDLSLRFARLRRVVFDGCALRGLDLTEAELDHVTFRRCDLTGADFTAARVVEARIVGCDLVDLQGVAGLAGAHVEVGALPALAPALAGHAGLRLGSPDELEALSG